MRGVMLHLIVEKKIKEKNKNKKMMGFIMSLSFEDRICHDIFYYKNTITKVFFGIFSIKVFEEYDQFFLVEIVIPHFNIIP